MARKNRGLGRGLDALIPRREEIEKAMQIPESTDVDVFFSDEEEDDGDAPAGNGIDYSGRGTRYNYQNIRSNNELSAENDESDPVQFSGNTNNHVDSINDSSFRDNTAGDVITVRISEVEPNRSQPRKTFDEDKLEELASSVAEYGILQPILVQRREDHYEIIAGERRWRAAVKAGLKEIPVIVRDYTEKEILALSLIENIQRENLNAIEEAQAYQRLISEFGLAHEEVAQRVSKSRSTITNALRLLKLDERVQKMVVGGDLSMGHARALIPLEDAEKQFELAGRIVNEKLSVRETEREVKRILSKGEADGSVLTDKDSRAEEDRSVQLIYNEIEERLRQILHTKVVIKRGKKGKGKISIDFYNHDELEKLIEKLM